MLKPLLSYRGIDRIYEYSPNKSFLEELVMTYDLHELVEEDILEPTTQDKIDVYDQCLFIVLHFPKYNKSLSKYMGNEFNLILGKSYLTTLTTYQTEHILKLKGEFEKELGEVEADEQHKFSPYYLLYRMMDMMYDKTQRTLQAFAKDLRILETEVFQSSRLNKSILEQIMIRRRNAVVVKHMFIPHQEIIWSLQDEVQKFFGGELDVYFEDLAYKIDKILNMVGILDEDIESLYDTYNAMVNMKTNRIITLLTIFTAVTGVMTLISGIFGMNVLLPWAQEILSVRIILGTMIVIGISMVRFFRWKKRL